MIIVTEKHVYRLNSENSMFVSLYSDEQYMGKLNLMRFKEPEHTVYFEYTAPDHSKSTRPLTSDRIRCIVTSQE